MIKANDVIPKYPTIRYDIDLPPGHWSLGHFSNVNVMSRFIPPRDAKLEEYRFTNYQFL